MIGIKFEKPLQEDVLTRPLTVTLTHDVERVEPVVDKDGNIADYTKVVETVTEEVSETEEYDNPAPNTYARYAEAAAWCNANRAVIEDMGDYYEVVALPEPTVEEQTAELQARYTQVIQFALDAFAQTRGYDHINSACTYANSTDPQFRLEGEYCVALRDTTWRAGYALLDEVKAGTRPVPTEEELLTMLPVGSAKWPDEE